MAFLGLACALLLEAVMARAQDIHQTARAVDEHYNHLRSLQTDFTEIYRGAGAERSESGTLWLKKPRKMRWEYRSPREKLFVSDGRLSGFTFRQSGNCERQNSAPMTCVLRLHFYSAKLSWRMSYRDSRKQWIRLRGTHQTPFSEEFRRLWQTVSARCW